MIPDPKTIVKKPVSRSHFRKTLGKEYYILKRKMKWWTSPQKYASHVDRENRLPHSYIQHRSFLLRPLKDVDMYLQHNKIINLQLAISKINGIMIRPGETFSLWKLVGRPTRKKGYLDGLVLENGNIRKGTGGGLCQLGNLLYWMTLHTPLTIKERWRHSYDVFPDVNRTLPFGSGATLSYNYIDLQIENPTQDIFQIQLWLDAENLNGEILCNREKAYTYEVFETDHVFRHQYWGGYTRHNRIWKKKIHLSDHSETVELVTENHAILMYRPFLNE